MLLNIVADILAFNDRDGASSCDEKEQQVATLGHIQLLPEVATRSDIRSQLYNKNNNKNKTKITNNTDVRKVFDHWQVIMNKPKAQFTADRKRLIEKRLKTIGVISFEYKYPYNGIFYYENKYDEGTMLSGFLPSYKSDEANNHKAYMFRLVLCWMKQQSEKQ